LIINPKGAIYFGEWGSVLSVFPNLLINF